MLDFYTTLFGALFIASASTFFNALVKYLAAVPDRRSLVYVFESLLISILILNDMTESIQAYEQVARQGDTVGYLHMYFEVLFFFLYAGCLLSIEPNQAALNIALPLLADDRKKRASFWLMLVGVAICSFVWSIFFDGFRLESLSILGFALLSAIGAFLELTFKERVSAIYTFAVMVATVVWMVWGSSW